MGDGPAPSVAQDGTPGAIYPGGSEGAKAKLTDWQNVNPYGQISRGTRDAFVKSYDSGSPNLSLIGKAPNDNAAFEYNQIKIANSYEDSLSSQYQTLKSSEDAQAKAAQAAADAERNQQLSRQQAIEGTQSAGGIVTRAAAPVGPGLPSSILSSPLGVPGGYQFTGKSLLGS